MSSRWIDLDDKVVLVTGGSGSFGKHFVRTVLRHCTPRKLIVFSRDEQKQFDMQHDPGERYDVSRDHPDAKQQLLSYLKHGRETLEALSTLSDGDVYEGIDKN